MKKSMKVLVAMMFVLFTINLNGQETLETSPPKVEKNLLGLYYNNTYVIFSEIGLTYERALDPNWSVAIGMSKNLGILLDFGSYSRINLGVKYKFKKRDFLDIRPYNSFYLEFEGGLVGDSFTEMKSTEMGSVVLRLGYYKETENNFVIQFAGGIGAVGSTNVSDYSGGVGFFPILDARVTVGYKF